MSGESSTRFVDSGTAMVEFLEHYTVVCPGCRNAANVSATGDGKFHLFKPRRLTCANCGLTKEWASRSLTYPGPEQAIDWYFREPFYFQKRCAGHQLWIANREHLEFLRGYVAAMHRTRRRNALGWKNGSLASRIPKWIADSKNRTTILKALDDLEKMMEKELNVQKRVKRNKRIHS
jgi:hypothetical protein